MAAKRVATAASGRSVESPEWAGSNVQAIVERKYDAALDMEKPVILERFERVRHSQDRFVQIAF